MYLLKNLLDPDQALDTGDCKEMTIEQLREKAVEDFEPLFVRAKTVVRDRRGNVLPNLGETKEYADLPADHHSMMFSLIQVCLKAYKKLAVPKPKKDGKQAQLYKQPVDLPDIDDESKSISRQSNKANICIPSVN